MAASMNVSWRDETPPEFGHAMLKYFAFDPEYTNLNHGSYGSLPLPVIEACKILDSEAESSPDRWIRFGYLPRLTAVRQRIAATIGAKAEECVLVPNASHGISTVLRNIEWQKDDIIVTFNTTYGSVAATARYLSDSPPHPVVSKLALTFPTTPAKVVAQFRAHLRGLPARKNGQKVVAIIDSIISLPAILLPWKEMVQVCKEEGVTSLVDAAHAIGQEPNLDLSKADPDFWVSNCHKWLYAKRSCAVLYVPLRNQHLIKSTFPTSETYISPTDRPGPNFVEQFDWTATIDFVPYLSVAAALDFRQWLGGEDKINAYCRQMALQGSKRLAQILGTTGTVMDPTGEMTLNMVNVHLPLPSDLQPRAAVAKKMKEKILLERNIFAPIFFIEETGWWTRCSAQIWNEIRDFEKLGKVLVVACSEVIHELREEARLKSKL
ncbi:PLP-dependent transferase [Mycena latifolia]|nr:PLP-dependent transferase [Mycena latifolia]